MAGVSSLCSLRSSFLHTLLSLVLASAAVLSPYWCEGRQKLPKPLCSNARSHPACPPAPGLSDDPVPLSWETGDDRFIFPTFHTGIWTSCEENIHTDVWEEKCRSLMALTPASEKGIYWLCVGMELMYIGLLCISCVLLLVHWCLASWWPLGHHWGELLNTYAAVFTVLGGAVGMVAHMMFMQVFQVTASSRSEDFKIHSYTYSWSFYVAWVAFTCCMCSGVCTLNNYTKQVLIMRGKKRVLLYPWKTSVCKQSRYNPPPPPPLYPPPPLLSTPPPPLYPPPPLLSTPPPPLYPPPPPLSTPPPPLSPPPPCPSPLLHPSPLVHLSPPF